MTSTTFGIFLLAFALVAYGAPDEEILGKSKGYPVGNAANWFYDASVRVGSFCAPGRDTGHLSRKRQCVAGSKYADAPRTSARHARLSVERRWIAQSDG